MTDERHIKWSYMDHWRSNGPAGPIDQWHSHKTMSAFLKQIKATGFDAIDTFDFRIWQMYGDYGGPAKYQEMVQDHGPGADRQHVPRRRLRRPQLRARTCPRRTRTSSRTSG